MWNHMADYGWGSMGLGMLLFWGLLIAAIAVLADSWLSSRKRGTSRSALDILKERYARGEIGREEFEQKKRDLEQ
jgi:putative membrane protein